MAAILSKMGSSPSRAHSDAVEQLFDDVMYHESMQQKEDSFLTKFQHIVCKRAYLHALRTITNDKELLILTGSDIPNMIRQSDAQLRALRQIAQTKRAQNKR